MAPWYVRILSIITSIILYIPYIHFCILLCILDFSHSVIVFFHYLLCSLLVLVSSSLFFLHLLLQNFVLHILLSSSHFEQSRQLFCDCIDDVSFCVLFFQK